MTRPSSLKIACAVLFVLLCWAYSPTGIRLGLQGYAPTHLALARFIVASLFMAVIALLRGIALPRLRDAPTLLLLGLFAVSLHHVAINYGQRGVSAGAASVLAQSTPLFSLLIAHWVFKQVAGAWHWGCLLLGMAGAAIVVAGDRGLGQFDPHGLLILVAALSWSIYFALQKHHGHRYDALTITCYTVWSGTALLMVYLPGLLDDLGHAPSQANTAVLVLGVFPSALAYLAWAWVLRHCEVTRVTLALYLIPAFAMLIAAALLGERPSASVMLGGPLVLISVLALNLRPPRLPVQPGRQTSH